MGKVKPAEFLLVMRLLKEQGLCQKRKLQSLIHNVLNVFHLREQESWVVLWWVGGGHCLAARNNETLAVLFTENNSYCVTSAMQKRRM